MSASLHFAHTNDEESLGRGCFESSVARSPSTKTRLCPKSAEMTTYVGRFTGLLTAHNLKAVCRFFLGSSQYQPSEDGSMLRFPRRLILLGVTPGQELGNRPPNSSPRLQNMALQGWALWMLALGRSIQFSDPSNPKFGENRLFFFRSQGSWVCWTWLTGLIMKFG